VTAGRPSLPPQIPEFFLPLRGAKPAGALPLYKPVICALGDVHFAEGQTMRQAFLADVGSEILSLNWDQAQAGTIDENQLEKESESQAEFASLASAASKPENYKMWSRDFADFLYRTARIDRYHSPEFKVASNSGESESDFRIRVSQLTREKRDRTTEALRNKYGPKIALLEDRIRRAEQRVEKEKTDVRQAGIQTAISLGATLLGAFMGRKTFSTGTIGRASTTMRTGMRTVKERTDIAAASENLDVLQQQKQDLEAEFNAEMQALEGSTDPSKQAIDTVAERPKKADVAVRLVALVWCPCWKTKDGLDS
jgi:vacuolar-type H+-ATPase subunit D/Vma8